jgi:hypothetical protein
MDPDRIDVTWQTDDEAEITVDGEPFISLTTYGEDMFYGLYWDTDAGFEEAIDHTSTYLNDLYESLRNDITSEEDVILRIVHDLDDEHYLDGEDAWDVLTAADKEGSLYDILQEKIGLEETIEPTSFRANTPGPHISWEAHQDGQPYIGVLHDSIPGQELAGYATATGKVPGDDKALELGLTENLTREIGYISGHRHG